MPLKTKKKSKKIYVFSGRRLSVVLLSMSSGSWWSFLSMSSGGWWSSLFMSSGGGWWSSISMSSGGAVFLCLVSSGSIGGPFFLGQSLVVVSIPFSLFLLRFLVVSCPFFLFLPSVVVGGKYSLSFFLSSLVFYQLVVVVVSIPFSFLWLFLLPFLCLRSSRWCWSAILSLLSCSKCWWSLEFPTFLYFVPVGGE